MSWAVVAVALVIVGLALIVAEAFIPSGGLLTALAVVAAGAGVVLGFTRVDPGFGGVLVAGALLFGPLAFLFGMSRLPKTRFGRRIVLSQPDAIGVGSGTEESEYGGLVGREGEAVTPLRPAGVAEIDGGRYDVVTEGALVRKGSRVRVVRIEGNRVVVRPKDETALG